MAIKKIQKEKILHQGKALYLAYDQGMEHGPVEFNDWNVDPKHIIEIARKGKYTGMIFQKGIAEHYRSEIKKSRVPLIIKLNGKTRLVKGDPVSLQLCTVKEALKLGAAAVGYTIYLGSMHEQAMFVEFEHILDEAHAHGLPVIAWVYPRGVGTEGKSKTELMEYAARVSLELGADFAKIHPTGDLAAMKWAVKSAGKTKVVFAGGAKTDETAFIQYARECMKTGAVGLAIGRNIWQHPKPLEITQKIRKIVFKK